MLRYTLIISPLILLTACTSNVKFDDSEYRQVGQTQPLNSSTSNPKEVVYKSPEKLKYEADGYNERQLNLRYGHNLTIRKVIKTIRIHCTAQPLTNANQPNNEPLQFCHYQFPTTCGN